MAGLRCWRASSARVAASHFALPRSACPPSHAMNSNRLGACVFVASGAALVMAAWRWRRAKAARRHAQASRPPASTDLAPVSPSLNIHAPFIIGAQRAPHALCASKRACANAADACRRAGVAGASGSGKTTVCERIVDALKHDMVPSTLPSACTPQSGGLTSASTSSGIARGGHLQRLLLQRPWRCRPHELQL